MSVRPEDLLPYYQKNQERRIKTFEEVVKRAERRIVEAAARRDTSCQYRVPPSMPGHLSFDAQSCAAYVILRLQRLDYKVRYVPPGTLHISWAHIADPAIQRSPAIRLLEASRTTLPALPGIPAPPIPRRTQRPDGPPPMPEVERLDATERMRRVYADLRIGSSS
jgi:hypothetical protein